MDDTKNEQQVIIMSLDDVEGIAKFIEDNIDEQTVVTITLEN